MKRMYVCKYDGTLEGVIVHENQVIKRDLVIDFIDEVYNYGSFTKGFSEVVEGRSVRNIKTDLMFINTMDDLTAYCIDIVEDRRPHLVFDKECNICYMIADGKIYKETFDYDESKFFEEDIDGRINLVISCLVDLTNISER